MLRRAFAASALCVATLVGGGYGAFAAPPDYAASGSVATKTVDAEWTDVKRGRVVPVRLRVPDVAPGAAPVVVFSHGLGGSRDAGALWGAHWASHGYLVVHVQHPGSDESVWKAKAGSPAEAVRSLKSAANARQLETRAADVAFVLDELARRREAGEAFLQAADLSRIGMSGHSFGAHTTLAIAGQRYLRRGEPPFRDARVKAAVAFSPAAREKAGDLDAQFGAFAIPVMSLTGTEDGDVIGTGATPASRTLPFAHMKPGGKYLTVFEGADHMVFGGQVLRRAERPRDREIREDVKALTLAFWDAHLRSRDEARAWLAGEGARARLAAGDRLEAKP